MGNVHILPPEIISKIAAGEVIERPASVIKELIENSLDAETNSVELHLKQAGKTSIHIKDTGTGIKADDIEKIFLRHSTSKINSIADLSSINSLGFRGEALYSVAAISDVTLRSKTADSSEGWEIRLRAGEKTGLRPMNMPVGTEIEVKELFFNTPARKKFLKSNSTELTQILNIFIPYTILHPNRRFLLTHNGRTILDLSNTNNAFNRISKALNIEEKHIIETNSNLPEKDISVRLYLGDINIQRIKKDMQFIFINSRPVQNRSINFNINQVYRLLFPQNTYPFFAANLHIPKEDVDVNAHPTKREVKIKDEYSISSFLRSVCEKSLMSHGKAKQIKEISPNYGNENFTGDFGKSLSNPSANKQYILSDPHLSYVPAEENLLTANKTNLKDKLANANYVGAFIKKYIFFETENSLLIIDQHAAQERITYENLIRQINAGKIEIQRMLSPAIIRLSPQELLVWEVIKDQLEAIGLSTTLWDNENIALHTHPNLIPNPVNAVRTLLSGEERTRFDLETLARRACRGSLMTGYTMTSQQAKYLIQQLMKCTDPFICPHGRPTVVEIEEKILNKPFLR